MENCIDINLDVSKKACARNFPKAPRGSPRKGQKIQKAQIQPSKTSFDRENDTDYEYKYPLEYGVGPCSRNRKNS